MQQAGADANAQIEDAYRLAYGRRPDGWEKDTVLTFFAKQKGIVTERVAAGEKLALPPGSLAPGVEPAQAAVLVDFCHMLLNSNEFVYRN